MPTFEQHDYWIGEHFLSPLINGDYTGLSDSEERDLVKFLEAETNGMIGHWTPLDESNEFAVCDVTGARGAVTKTAFMEAIQK